MLHSACDLERARPAILFDDDFRDRSRVCRASAADCFSLCQRYGHWMTEKLAARMLPGAVAPTAALAASLDAIYGQPRRVGLSLALHFAGWIASALGHGSPFA